MAELERHAALERQQGEKRTQPRHVLLESRRQLKQQRSQALLQLAGHFEKARDQVACILEPLPVRNLFRRLEHELEIGGHRGCPCFQDRRRGQATKRVVDLDRPKMPAVKGEHLLGRQLRGVERTLPFLVGIATGADVEVHGCTCRMWTLRLNAQMTHTTKTGLARRPWLARFWRAAN